ncbi:oligosaccharide flippase family protein [Clostridium perfringens]|uniref:lipopolysaccharide biosynthesis protein n=1 Tax=Clostridium perfringens TaxID=1502 RepID=UPI0018E403F1|nr:oligosaccharide flippase family protein [Clostridium perfringens]MDK0710434.1 oligosaccharide flippase family protein [Clostridium perfringens]MDK0713317.1 oligosaccharide flippase family protein [Clostridium perfringens]
MRLDEMKFGTVISYINIFISLISGMLITPLMIKFMGSNEYGLYNLMGAFTSYLSILEAGLGFTIVRYVAKYNYEKDKRGRENILAYCTIAYFIICFAIILASMYIYRNIDLIFSKSLAKSQLSDAKIMFIILTLTIVITTINSLFTSALSGCEKFIIPRFFSCTISVLKIILIVLLMLSYPSAVLLTLLTLVLSILNLILNIYYAIKKIKIKIKFHFWDSKLFLELLIFTSFNFIQVLINQLYWKVDEIILGTMISTSVVAIYSVSMQLNMFTMNFASTASSVVLPKATHLITANSDDKSIAKFTAKVSRIILILYLLILIGFVFFGKKFIILWVGYDYIPAYYISVAIIASTLIPRVQDPINDIVRAKNMHGILNIIIFLAGIINVCMSIIFVHLYGIYGVVIGTVISLIIGNILIGNIYYKKKVGINLKIYFSETFSGIWKCILPIIVLCILLSIFNYVNWSVLILQCLLYLIGFLLILFKWGLNTQEKQIVKKLVLKINFIKFKDKINTFIN